MNKVTLSFVSLVFVSGFLPARPQMTLSTSEDEVALSAATQELCPVQVAMLGEAANHGDSHTIAFKVALVERLVDQCGFDSMFFEANHDEFIALNRRLRLKQPVTQDDLLSAVGGIWKFYREFQPIAPYLLERAESGRLFLGGIDDQLGQLGQDYANVGMIAEWTKLLPPAESKRCGTALHKRIYGDYTDAAPYSRADRSQIDTCLSEIQAASNVDRDVGRVEGEERREMISATQRWIARDFESGTESLVNRDRSMFQDFEWLQSRAPKRRKVIVWAATVHIAKQGDPAWGDRTGTNFGTFVHQEFGGKASSVGFSALAGSYREGGKFPVIPPPPPDSLEVRASQGTRGIISYVGKAQLAAVGTLPGAFFRHSYETLLWSNFLDGVVVFRSEHPPSDLRAGNP